MNDVEVHRVGSLRVRSELRLRNATMINGRRRLGLNQNQAAEKAGVSASKWMGLEKLDYSSKHVEEEAFKVAILLVVPVDDILPLEFKGRKQQHTVVKDQAVKVEDLRRIDRLTDFEHRQTKRLVSRDPLEEAERKEELELLREKMSSLPSKQRTTLGLRMQGYSLESISKLIDVSRERVRQIEKLAIRKLGQKMEKEERHGEALCRSRITRSREGYDELGQHEFKRSMGETVLRRLKNKDRWRWINLLISSAGNWWAEGYTKKEIEHKWRGRGVTEGEIVGMCVTMVGLHPGFLHEHDDEMITITDRRMIFWEEKREVHRRVRT